MEPIYHEQLRAARTCSFRDIPAPVAAYRRLSAFTVGANRDLRDLRDLPGRNFRNLDRLQRLS